jgi:phosphomannomutase/phosphoglucomutase
MKVNKYIFREYDIRGKVKEDFPPEVVLNLGKAFGTFIKRSGGQEVALSGDVRLSTPDLIQQFKEGVLSTGVDIINIGIVPTPVNYYSMFKLDVAGAVQITGSHNPPEFNGFKMSRNKKSVFGESIQNLREVIESEDFEKGEGDEASYNILNDYKKMINSKIKLNRKLNVVLDCGNAAGAVCAPEIFKNLNLELDELYCDVDGTFPNHHPDPTVEENLEDLIQKMKTGKYDVGIAFDGDADRIGVVDEKGGVIWADQLMALFLPEIISPGDEILYDVKCSKSLEEMIVRYGGKPVMWKTGHSLVKQKMFELNCKFGGEMSGHIFFADDYFGFDDGIYVAARLLQTLSRSSKKLSELKDELPRYYSTPEMRLEANSDEDKFKISKIAVEYFTKNYDCSTVDGVRINFDDGWGLVRASNTQPVIVCRFEATSPEKMDEYKNLVISKLNEIGDLRSDVGH